MNPSKGNSKAREEARYEEEARRKTNKEVNQARQPRAIDYPIFSAKEQVEHDKKVKDRFIRQMVAKKLEKSMSKVKRCELNSVEEKMFSKDFLEFMMKVTDASPTIDNLDLYRYMETFAWDLLARKVETPFLPNMFDVLTDQAVDPGQIVGCVKAAIGFLDRFNCVAAEKLWFNEQLIKGQKYQNFGVSLKHSLLMFCNVAVKLNSVYQPQTNYLQATDDRTKYHWLLQLQLICNMARDSLIPGTLREYKDSIDKSPDFFYTKVLLETINSMLERLLSSNLNYELDSILDHPKVLAAIDMMLTPDGQHYTLMSDRLFSFNKMMDKMNELPPPEFHDFIQEIDPSLYESLI